uniref:Uncharacterized protein n=1 Tax=Entomoneis paludosa TaxID=265537 RepID=A0A7S2YHC2_9STRA|mmetsp:Transcript_32884/g.68536  ORF Transcript_32884/g.68536 Transcript_32884/m.68536 type:complete len:159 (+) Transcript_32884:90-566(+)|eukprot:CAMPEP_0172442854 /NCGR_PEP_ID=MMETSP1065-20121228/3233_1 /TAXON_ID=265537 /ORGANISM="Amphiprora paludosa, Strain CCMP125" /LENGTH=158 /DNA_ID=CAMNT_0013192899 /DNA_START=54 /DNA_END=530 /DNA_ORIENTATION=+
MENRPPPPRISPALIEAVAEELANTQQSVASTDDEGRSTDSEEKRLGTGASKAELSMKDSSRRDPEESHVESTAAISDDDQRNKDNAKAKGTPLRQKNRQSPPQPSPSPEGAKTATGASLPAGKPLPMKPSLPDHVIHQQENEKKKKKKKTKNKTDTS